MSAFLEVITSPDPEVRNTPIESLVQGMDAHALWQACRELDAFRRSSENLYERVRALFFLFAICRFPLPEQVRHLPAGRIPARVHADLLDRRFQEAINGLLATIGDNLPDDALCSGLA